MRSCILELEGRRLVSGASRPFVLAPWLMRLSRPQPRTTFLAFLPLSHSEFKPLSTGRRNRLSSIRRLCRRNDRYQLRQALLGRSLWMADIGAEQKLTSE